ncbi:hypothetical protein MAM1_0119c05805 [Mucor ambiguus]|uniref:Uncharacterized protein n=1 Tax=Mucor ambiguus TaxID=91626 RepID=A0A0C9MGD2_9FUNG|nr:hypothetical protein MAM1_0119c05805 [Mucor ambiguus]
MSTLNSFFTTRKSRNTCINKEKTLTSSEDESNRPSFAVQAPQPVYEILPKQQAAFSNTNGAAKNNTAKQNPSQDNSKSRNSILHYLSPVKTIQPTTEEIITTTSTTTATPLCQIRQNIPVKHVWNIILEEFDPQSQPNQFEASPSPSPTIEKAELCTINDMLMSNSRRRKLEDTTSRCVRIRTIGPAVSSMDIFRIEDYLFEDTNEDLSRPLRNKHTLTESNNFFMEMLESLVYLE